MSDEEEDYMSDAVLNSCGDVRPGLYKGSKEAHKRLQQHKQEVSKKQQQRPLKVVEAEKRDEGLGKSIDSTNKGFALLQKMGYKPGQGIGKSGEGRLEPVGIELKVNRGGLGQEAERRKREKELQTLREHQHAKKMKYAQQVQDNYRHIKISEQKQRRLEKSLGQSQRVCEQLDHSKNIDVPLRSYFWPIELRPTASDDATIASDDVTTVSDDVTTVSGDVDDTVKDVEDDEPEVSEQLEQVTEYLRAEHLYCIWCGYAFDDSLSLANDCPGNTAEDHDDL